MDKQSIAEASTQLYNAILQHLIDVRGGVHVETAITAAGGLCGTAILTVAGVDISNISPGTVVLCAEVNLIGPIVISFMQNACNNVGIDPESGWDKDIPEDHQPHRNLLELTGELIPEVNRIYSECGVSGEDQPFVGALTAVRFIDCAKEILDPEVGKSLALWAIIQASKTVPLSTPPKTPGFLSRLMAH